PRGFANTALEHPANPPSPHARAAPRRASPWAEQPPPMGGGPRAFPKMTFEDLDKAAPPPPPPPAPIPEPEPETPSWAMSTPEPPPSAPSMWDEPPQYSGETKAFPKMSFEDLDKMSSEPAKAPPPPPPPEPEPEPATEIDVAAAVRAMPEGSKLSDDEVDRIARRVVQLMSDTVIRNIAWEVIPDLAEMVVKERIKQLESE